MEGKGRLSYRFAVIASAGILFLYFFPYFYLGQSSYISIHDNLDSDVVWFKTIAQSGKLFSFSNDIEINRVMNGIPRNSLPPALNFVSILFYFLTPFTAYVFNHVITHIVAFAGMFFLLKDFVFNKRGEEPFLFGIPLAFALLPFYGTHPGLAIAGIPIVTWCLTHLYRSTHRVYHFATLTLFPFYSSLIYTGIFIVILASGALLYLILRKRKPSGAFISGIALLIFGYILSELNLFVQFFSKDFVPHRKEFLIPGIDLLAAVKKGITLVLEGQYHAPTENTPFVTLTCLIGVFYSLRYLILRKKPINLGKHETLAIVLFLLIASISLFYGLWYSNGVNYLKNEFFILRIIQWNRFYWLNPFLWYLLFALCTKALLNNNIVIIRRALYGAVLLQLLFVVYNNEELKRNYSKVISETYPRANPFKELPIAPSFKQFYDKKLFLEIKSYIGLPQREYRVVSLGMFPEITIYNGFYTLDGYQRNYSLGYKHRFRQIIRHELDKSEELKSYFDNWGSRCYAFSAELQQNYMVNKNDGILIKNLDFDFDAFKALGGKYIFSTAPIDSTQNKSIVLHRSFEHRDSYWKIYLYEVY